MHQAIFSKFGKNEYFDRYQLVGLCGIHHHFLPLPCLSLTLYIIDFFTNLNENTLSRKVKFCGEIQGLWLVFICHEFGAFVSLCILCSLLKMDPVQEDQLM